MVAALGAGGITGLLGFGTVWWQQRHRDQAEAAGRRHAAYLAMISHSAAFMTRAAALRTMMQARSGLKEGVDIVAGIRKPLDPLDLHDWIAQDYAPLNEAWSRVEIAGSAHAVRAATTLLDACGEMLGLATAAGEAHGKLASAVKGVAWTSQQQKALERATQRVAKSRHDFIALARKELALETVAFPVELTSPRATASGLEKQCADTTHGDPSQESRQHS